MQCAGAKIFLKGGASTFHSEVAQRKRVRLPMQETQVQSLIQEDPTCLGATKPVRHNYRACALEPLSHNYRANVLQLLKPVRPRAHSLQQQATAMRSLCTATRE